jgi:hypothetical protein
LLNLIQALLAHLQNPPAQDPNYVVPANPPVIPVNPIVNALTNTGGLPTFIKGKKNERNDILKALDDL